MSEQIGGPHQNQPVLTAGVPLSQASAAMILIHGRGADAESIMELAAQFKERDFAYLAPQAAGNEWYPNRFLAPIESNEPNLSSALAVIASLLAQLEEVGIAPERTMLLGFSQGACLLTEYVARHALRYGGVIGLSGGLIGPDDTARDYPGSLDDTPVFLGCSDTDPHIPRERVELTADVLRRMDGQVTMRLYPGMGHTVNLDELRSILQLMAALKR